MRCAIQPLYKSILRGHVTRLIARGRPKSDALSDASFLTAFASAVNVISIGLFAGINLPDSRAIVFSIGLAIFGVSHVIHRWLVRKWANELDRPSASDDNGRKFISDSAFSILYTFGSYFLGLVAFAVSSRAV